MATTGAEFLRHHHTACLLSPSKVSEVEVKCVARTKKKNGELKDTSWDLIVLSYTLSSEKSSRTSPPKLEYSVLTLSSTLIWLTGPHSPGRLALGKHPNSGDRWVILKRTGKQPQNCAVLIVTLWDKCTSTSGVWKSRGLYLESLSEKLKEIWEQELIYRGCFI